MNIELVNRKELERSYTETLPGYGSPDHIERIKFLEDLIERRCVLVAV